MNDMMVIPEILDRSVATTKFETLEDMVGKVPRQAIWLGKADDGIDVTFYLNDPAPAVNLTLSTSLLVVDDANDILQVIGKAIIKTHARSDVVFGMLTNSSAQFPNEYCSGVFRFCSQGASALLSAMVIWGKSNKSDIQHVVLLIDDLTNIQYMSFEDKENLHWLLFQGPKHKIHPVATIGNEISCPWPDAFEARIYHTGNRFVMQEGLDCIAFRIPLVF